MEESELTLETFWKNHFIRLNKCLDLRKFEQKFKDVRHYYLIYVTNDNICFAKEIFVTFAHMRC